jgi:hypothetical protein
LNGASKSLEDDEDQVCFQRVLHSLFRKHLWSQQHTSFERITMTQVSTIEQTGRQRLDDLTVEVGSYVSFEHQVELR